MPHDFLSSVRKQFESYKSLGEKTFSQLRDDDLSWQYNPESNSVTTIVKHLSGNMLSRWTDFLNTDGEKEWRQRDAEFENEVKSRDELLSTWNKGWNCLFEALDSLQPTDLSKEVLIRNQPLSVMDAINRQLTHYSYHVGQIVYIAKMRLNEQWKSLTIPRGKSADYNIKKFADAKNK